MQPARDKIFEKHKINFDAGKLLTADNNEYFAPSIHCYYYSIYQLTEYILRDVLNLSKTSIEESKKKYYSTGGNQRSSHEVTIMICFMELLKASSVKVATTYKDGMLELKKLRHQADYKNIHIDKEISDAAYKLCEKIQIELYTQFKL